MGKWWLASSSWQCTSSCITSCTVFWENIKSPRWVSLPTAQIWCLWLLAFPKTKITCEGEEISDLRWDAGQYDGAVNGCRESCVRFQGTYFEGDWGTVVLCTIFLESCILNKISLFFILHGLDAFLTYFACYEILLSCKEKWNTAISNNMDESSEYANQNTFIRES